MRAFKAALTVLLIVPFPATLAQEALRIERGQRVRVTAPLTGVFRLHGRWVDGGPDTIRVRLDSDGTVAALPRSRVARLDVWTGRRSHWLAGATLGFLAGATAGLVTATTPVCKPNVDCFGIDVVVLGLPAVGLVAGGLIGALVRSDRWKEVSLDKATSVTLVPLRDGRFALGVSVSF